MYGFNVWVQCLCMYFYYLYGERLYVRLRAYRKKKKERRYRVSRDTDGRQWIYVENP